MFIEDSYITGASSEIFHDPLIFWEGGGRGALPYKNKFWP